MEYKILLTDLDGTLLDSRGQISEENKRAVKLALDAGKKIVICSGRSFLSLIYFEKILGTDKPGQYGVAFNGGSVYVHTETGRDFLCEHLMENTLGQEIIAELKHIKADILAYADEGLIAEEETPDIWGYSDHARIPVTIIGDFKKIKSGFVKILVKGPNAVLRETMHACMPRFGERCNIFFSAKTLLEFCPLSAHKGNAVDFLARHLNITAEEVIAVGDEANDVTMLKQAGLGIAVANAVPEAVLAAKVHIAESNNDSALSAVIHRYLLR